MEGLTNEDLGSGHVTCGEDGGPVKQMRMSTRSGPAPNQLRVPRGVRKPHPRGKQKHITSSPVPQAPPTTSQATPPANHPEHIKPHPLPSSPQSHSDVSVPIPTANGHSTEAPHTSSSGHTHHRGGYTVADILSPNRAHAHSNRSTPPQNQSTFLPFFLPNSHAPQNATNPRYTLENATDFSTFYPYSRPSNPVFNTSTNSPVAFSPTLQLDPPPHSTFESLFAPPLRGQIEASVPGVSVYDLYGLSDSRGATLLGTENRSSSLRGNPFPDQSVPSAVSVANGGQSFNGLPQEQFDVFEPSNGFYNRGNGNGREFSGGNEQSDSFVAAVREDPNASGMMTSLSNAESENGYQMFDPFSTLGHSLAQSRSTVPTIPLSDYSDPTTMRNVPLPISIPCTLAWSDSHSAAATSERESQLTVPTIHHEATSEHETEFTVPTIHHEQLLSNATASQSHSHSATATSERESELTVPTTHHEQLLSNATASQSHSHSAEDGMERRQRAIRGKGRLTRNSEQSTSGLNDDHKSNGPVPLNESLGKKSLFEVYAMDESSTAVVGALNSLTSSSQTAGSSSLTKPHTKKSSVETSNSSIAANMGQSSTSAGGALNSLTSSSQTATSADLVPPPTRRSQRSRGSRGQSANEVEEIKPTPSRVRHVRRRCQQSSNGLQTGQSSSASSTVESGPSSFEGPSLPRSAQEMAFHMDFGPAPQETTPATLSGQPLEAGQTGFSSRPGTSALQPIVISDWPRSSSQRAPGSQRSRGRGTPASPAHTSGDREEEEVEVIVVDSGSSDESDSDDVIVGDVIPGVDLPFVPPSPPTFEMVRSARHRMVLRPHPPEMGQEVDSSDDDDDDDDEGAFVGGDDVIPLPTNVLNFLIDSATGTRDNFHALAHHWTSGDAQHFRQQQQQTTRHHFPSSRGIPHLRTRGNPVPSPPPPHVATTMPPPPTPPPHVAAATTARGNPRGRRGGGENPHPPHPHHYHHHRSRGPLPRSMIFQQLLYMRPRYEELLELAERLGPARSQGLSQSVLRSLPEWEFKDAGSKECCVVCMSEYIVKEIVRALPCQHNFHSACINKWLKDHRTCPICRVEVKAQ